MTKRIAALILVLLCLCGCGGGADAPTYIPLSAADQLLDSGAFAGSEMAPVELEVAAVLFGIDLSTVVEGTYYMAVNTSVSADELLILTLTDEAAALAAQEACKARVEAQLTVCESYCPAAVPRLQGARLTLAGNSLLFAVGDPDLVGSVEIK